VVSEVGRPDAGVEAGRPPADLPVQHLDDLVVVEPRDGRRADPAAGIHDEIVGQLERGVEPVELRRVGAG
jgi:hypothetical protein